MKRLTKDNSAGSRVTPIAAMVDGNGVGDVMECFRLVNTTFRDDKGPVRYGDQVALLSLAAGGKYMAWYDMIFNSCFFFSTS